MRLLTNEIDDCIKKKSKNVWRVCRRNYRLRPAATWQGMSFMGISTLVVGVGRKGNNNIGKKRNNSESKQKSTKQK